MNQLLRILCLSFFLVVGLALPLHAADEVWWDGGPAGTGLDYEVAANWNPDGVPTDPDDPSLYNDVVLLKNNVTTPIADNLSIGATFPLGGGGAAGRSYFYQSTGILETDWTTIAGIGGGEELGGSVGVLYQSGGTHKLGGPEQNTTFAVGRSAGGYGYFNMSGGLLYAGHVQMGRDSATDCGAIYQTGGTITDVYDGSVGHSVFVGAKGVGAYNLTGGSCILNVDASSYLTIGHQGDGAEEGWGNMNVSDDGELYVLMDLTIGNETNNVGYLTLGEGGTITARDITTRQANEGESYFSLHGGKLKPVADQTDFIDLSGAATGGEVYVGAEGGIIDTDGHSIEIQEPLRKLEGSGVSSITVTAAGSGYAGPPVVKFSTDGDGHGASAMAYVDSTMNGQTGDVSDGQVINIVVTNPGEDYEGENVTVTLECGGYTTLATATATLAANGQDGGITKTGEGRLTLSAVNTYTGLTDVQEGTLAGSGSIAGDVLVASGCSIEPGKSIGTLTILGDVDLGSSTLGIEYDDDEQTIDVLDVAGDLDIEYATVDFAEYGEEGGELTEPAYVFAKYGTLIGEEFATATNIPSGYSIDYNYLGGNQIALVPEPATLILLLTGLLGLAAYVRRRR